MSQEWYYTKGGQKAGPVAGEKLQELARSGELTPQDMVWKEGMAGWMPAGQIKGIFPQTPPPSVPSPPPIPPAGPPPVPGTTQGSTNLFSNLGMKITTPLWIKLVSGLGLFFLFVGLLCPWYKYAGHSTVDVRGLDTGGFGFDSGVGRGPRGSGLHSQSTNISFLGIETLPGGTIIPFLLAGGFFSFWPYRWSSVAVVGAGALILLLIFWGFFYGPSIDSSASVGQAGMGARASAKAGSSWGQWISLLGDLTVVVAAVLIFLGIARGEKPTSISLRR